jgi:hypothetical protein
MFLVTKWWYVIPVDGPDKMYWGFPFPFLGEGFHTSMSFQFFVVEFVADLIFYFLVWLCFFYLISKINSISNVSNFLLKTVWSLSFLLGIGFIILVSNSNPIFRFKRDYDWKILGTGHVFIWQETPRPDINQYHKDK